MGFFPQNSSSTFSQFAKIGVLKLNLLGRVWLSLIARLAMRPWLKSQVVWIWLYPFSVSIGVVLEKLHSVSVLPFWPHGILHFKRLGLTGPFCLSSSLLLFVRISFFFGQHRNIRCPYLVIAIATSASLFLFSNDSSMAKLLVPAVRLSFKVVFAHGQSTLMIRYYSDIYMTTCIRRTHIGSDLIWTRQILPIVQNEFDLYL
jgi:hypothetical protein